MDQPFIGQINEFGFKFAPKTWTICGGQLLTISSNQSLFSLLGTYYGGDGRTNFGIPDLRGRAPVGQGQGLGFSYNWFMGSQFGFEFTQLTVNELPSHTHIAKFSPTEGNTATSVGVNASNSDGETSTPT